MKLEQLLSSFSAPKGVTSVLAGVMTGDFSVLPHQGNLSETSNLDAALAAAEAGLEKQRQNLKECKSDWAYWSILGDVAYWEATVDILKGAKLVGPDNMPDMLFEDKGGVVMDSIAAVEQYGKEILRLCEARVRTEKGINKQPINNGGTVVSERIDLFEKAKQAVAKEYKASSWDGLMCFGDYRDNEEYYREVFEQGCNEAVKADREQIITENPTWCTHNTSFIDDDRLHKLPLPFPQKPEGK